MYPLTPAPTLIVDTWGFRLGDKDGNLIGRTSSVTITDAAGTPIALPPAPGIERSVQALPDE
jgi:hypothetical protein